MLCDFYGDGQTYQENYFVKYYQKLGHYVVVIASTNENILDYVIDVHNNNLPKKIYNLGEKAKIYRLPYKWNIKNKIKKFPEILEILNLEKPDLIYCHGLHFNLKEAVQYSKLNPVKIIMDAHADFSNSANSWLSKNVLNKFIRRYFLQIYKNYISKFYAVVPEAKKFMHEMYGISEESIELLPLGCDYELMKKIKANTDINEEREKYNILKDDFVIITGGKLNPQKRTEVIIKAVKKISNKKIKLLIFGSPDQLNLDYYDYLKSISAQENIFFTGWLSAEKIFELMSVCNLAVFPASQSVVWQQSIGMGLPLICGDAGGQNMSYLNVYNNLIKINAENLTSKFFAEVIIDLYENPKKLEVMKAGAILTGANFLNYERIAEKTLECLK